LLHEILQFFGSRLVVDLDTEIHDVLIHGFLRCG
jgi:phosphoribosylformimino-5-aminoimidazole carboxamide ribonucleotide (ProFAR) isomerase